MTDELRELMRQKRDLERRIMILTTGSIVNDMVKVDRIGYAGKFQQGKWALFFKYAHVVNTGCHGVPETRTKWQPMINADTKEEVINQIPGAIKALTELYEQAVKENEPDA